MGKHQARERNGLLAEEQSTCRWTLASAQNNALRRRGTIKPRRSPPAGLKFRAAQLAKEDKELLKKF